MGICKTCGVVITGKGRLYCISCAEKRELVAVTKCKTCGIAVFGRGRKYCIGCSKLAERKSHNAWRLKNLDRVRALHNAYNQKRRLAKGNPKCKDCGIELVGCDWKRKFCEACKRKRELCCEKKLRKQKLVEREPRHCKVCGILMEGRHRTYCLVCSDERVKASQRLYNQRLDVKARQALYAKKRSLSPEAREKQKIAKKKYFQRPEIRERQKVYDWWVRHDPDRLQKRTTETVERICPEFSKPVKNALVMDGSSLQQELYKRGFNFRGEKMDTETKIKVVSQLVAEQCIEYATAKQLISSLIVVEPKKEFEFSVMMDGLKELVESGLINKESGISYARKLGENYLAGAKAFNPRGSNAESERADYTHHRSRGTKNRFASGELREFVMQAIAKGNKKTPDIAQYVSNISAVDLDYCKGTVSGTLTLLRQSGKVAKDPDGNHTILEYPSMQKKEEWEGKKSFVSKKEIEGEMK